MKTHERHTGFRAITSATTIAILGFLTLSCSATEAGSDSKPASKTDLEFIYRSAATTIYSGGNTSRVGILPQELEDDYNDYPVYQHGDDWDDNFDNNISFKPRRFKTDFRKGDGSGADTVCEDLGIPEGTEYVQAVTNSNSPAWVAYNEEEEDEVHLCYKTSDMPKDVAVWAGNEDR